MFNRNTRKIIGSILIAALFLMVPVFTKGGYACHVFIMIYLNIIFATTLGLVLKMGYLSLGHFAYVLVGAYTSAVLTTKFNWTFWPGMIMGGAAAGILGFIIGRITLRLTGIFFTITTFSFCEVLRALCLKLRYPLGGAQGITDIPPPVVDFLGVHLTLNTMFSYYYLALIITSIIILILYRLERSRLGLIWNALNQAEVLAASVGVNTIRYKTLNFVIVCFFTGIGGSLLAHYVTFISPFSFTFWQSIYTVFYCVVGGGGIIGPIVGAGVFTAIGEYLYGTGTWASIIFGICLILALLFMPNGLISLPQRLGAIRRKVSMGL